MFEQADFASVDKGLMASMDESGKYHAEASDLIERLARIMRSEEHDTGLNPAQWEALRYIARCNRFSNSPAALTDYVCATRGTVSQTLNALERKGLICKKQRESDKRSVSLHLTSKGAKTLNWDPWQRIDVYENEIGRDELASLIYGLKKLLAFEFSRNRLKSFGACENCRYFESAVGRRKGRGPHRCSRFDATICDDERASICAFHEIAPICETAPVRFVSS